MPLIVPPQNIAATGVQSNPTQAISGMLDMQNKSNQNQIGKQTIQSNDMNLQSQTQANQERVATNDFMSQPENWQTNGKIDMSKLNSAIPNIAPQTGSALLQKMGTLSQSQTQADQAQQNMTQSQRAIIAGPLRVMGQMGEQDPQKYADEIDNLVQQNPDNKSLGQLAQAYKMQLQHIPPGPHVAEGAIKMSQGLLDPSQQQAQLSPSASLLNKGGEFQPVISTPSVGGNAPTIAPNGAPGIANTLPPGQQQSITKDAYGRDVVVNRAPTGAITSTGQVPGGQGGFQSLPPGETPGTLAQVQQIRTNANTAATSAPDQQFNTNQIIKYSNETDTGKAGGYLRAMKGSLAAVPWTADSVTNYQLMGHAIAQQQGALAASAGLNGTNASRELAGQQTADGEWTKPAIQSAARTSRALATGSQLYSQGMENAVGGGDPFAARTFQNRWSNVANVNSLRLYDAVKNQASDPQGVKAVVDALGGPQSLQYKMSLKKVDEMQKLIRGQ